MLQYYNKLICFIETILNIIIAITMLYKNITGKYIIKKIKPEYNEVHILGNGPSLKLDYDKIKLVINEGTSLMAVNSFACTELYEEFKPDLYIIVDPAFFRASDNSRIINLQNNISNALKNKTKWPLTLFLPETAHKSKFTKIIRGNRNIEIKFILNIPTIGGFQKVNNFLFKFNLANPIYQNVLIAAIFTCIKLLYTNIYIWGADHSWHENYSIGKDNFIHTPDVHFYNENKTNFVLLNQNGKPITVHQEFESLSRTFKVYHSLESFSKINKCKITNMSSYSWIDAFVRI